MRRVVPVDCERRRDIEVSGMRACAVAVLTTLLVACQSIEIDADFEPSADFGRFRTFSWISDEPLLVAEPDTVNPLLAPNLTAMTRATFVAKGFEFVSARERADFLVGFAVGPANALEAFDDQTDAGDPITLNPAADAGVDFRHQLTFTIFDAARRVPVWRATVRKNVTGREQANFEGVLRKVVEAALAGFPPR
jgi:hypothetical protein